MQGTWIKSWVPRVSGGLAPTIARFRKQRGRWSESVGSSLFSVCLDMCFPVSKIDTFFFKLTLCECKKPWKPGKVCSQYACFMKTLHIHGFKVFAWGKYIYILHVRHFSSRFLLRKMRTDMWPRISHTGTTSASLINSWIRENSFYFPKMVRK